MRSQSVDSSGNDDAFGNEDGKKRNLKNASFRSGTLSKSLKMKKKKSTKNLVEVKGGLASSKKDHIIASDDVDMFSDPKVNQRR